MRLLFLTCFGLGLLPRAPGTFGSLPPVIFAVVAAQHLTNTTTDLTLCVIAIVFATACIAWGGWGERRFGKKDASAIVADEVAGMSVALLFLPWRSGDEPSAFGFNAALGAIAFGAFRLFDIWKPPPARQVQVWPRGWGVLADDLVAGLYALAAAQLLARYALPLFM